MKQVTVTQTIYEHGDVLELRGENLPNSFKRKSFNISVRAMVIKRTVSAEGVSRYHVLLDNFDKAYVKIENVKDVKYLGHIDDQLLYSMEEEQKEPQG